MLIPGQLQQRGMCNNSTFESIMNTEQNYGGKGDSANHPTPAAQNAAQTPSPADIRQTYFQTIAASKGATEYLHHLIDLVADHNQEINPIPAINELAASWIRQPVTDWDDPETTHNLRTVLKLGAFLTRLRDTYAAFEAETDGLTYDGEEGENE